LASDIESFEKENNLLPLLGVFNTQQKTDEI
jgi:hypothetical protein